MTTRRASGPSGSADSNGFRYRRRVQFAETDLAGVVHFSCFFRYMEEAEHALWRAAGLSIHPQASETLWPRVAASFDFRNPLFFEDEFDVTVRVDHVTTRTIQYAFVVTRGQSTIGSGAMTAACAHLKQGGGLKAVPVPPDVISRLRAASGQAA
jgi:YbgC/YbaW family acyl-CoA thioester hydrolase